MTKELSYEQASKELDGIILKLEDGNLALEESVKLFEKAQKLIAICEANFSSAKGKLTIIRDGLEKTLKSME